MKDLIILEPAEKDFISNFRANIFMPHLIFDTREHTFNSLLHPMALWRCKEFADLSKIQINFKQKIQLPVEEYKLLVDNIIYNSDENELQKMSGKLLTSFIKEKAEQENDMKLRQYTLDIINSIVAIDKVKKMLYTSQILNEEKMEIAYNFDKMILKLELGNYLTQNEANYFVAIRNKLIK